MNKIKSSIKVLLMFELYKTYRFCRTYIDFENSQIETKILQNKR